MTNTERRIAELEEQIKMLHQASDERDDRIIAEATQDSQARIAELEAALRKYGIHKNSCKMFPIMVTHPQPCTCGFAQALSRSDGSQLLNAIQAAVEALEQIEGDYYNDISSAEVFKIHSSIAKEALATLRPFARSQENKK